MWAAAGIVTTRKGITSHAVVAGDRASLLFAAAAPILLQLKSVKLVTTKGTNETLKGGDIISVRIDYTSSILTTEPKRSS